MSDSTLNKKKAVAGIVASNDNNGAGARGRRPCMRTSVRTAFVLLIVACFPWLAAQAQSTNAQSVSITVNHEVLPLGATDPNGTLEFTLTRTGAIADALEVDVSLTQERDWLSSSRLAQSVTFPAGVAEASFELTRSWFWEDNSDRLDKGILTATIQSGESYSISGELAAVFVVGRREPLGIISLDMAEYAFTEESEGQNFNVEVILTSGLTPSALADWFVAVSTEQGDTQDPNASSPEDYAPISRMVRIEADDYRLEGIRRIARVPVRIDVVDDEIYEPEERFNLLLEQSPGHLPSIFRLCIPSGTSYSCNSTGQEYPATIAESDSPEQPFVRLNRKILLEVDDPDTATEETSVTMTAGFKGGGVYGDDQTITIEFGGSAEAVADYTIAPFDADADPANGYQITLPAGSRSAGLTLTAIADSVDNEAETIEIAATLDFDNSAIGTAKVELYEDAASADDDATLRRLRLKSGSNYLPLSGGFRPHVTSYTTTVNRIVDRVRIEVEKNSLNASVSITGDTNPSKPGHADLDLQIGENLIEVTVTAGNGDSSTYQVNLTRLEELPVVSIEPENAEVEEGEPVRFRILLAERWPANVDIDVRGHETGAKTLVHSNPLLRVNYLGGRDPVRIRSMSVEDDDWPEGEGAVNAQIMPRPGHYTIGNPGKAAVRILDDDGDTMRKPDVPQQFEAIPGNGKATLAWDAPLSDGGSPITHYEYRVDHRANSAQPGETDGEWISTGGTDTSLTLTGLANINRTYQSHYQFQLRAVNTQGAGLSAESSARPTPRMSRPGAPRSLAAEADTSGGVILRWDPPAADGGAQIIRFEYNVDQSYFSSNSWSGDWHSTGDADTEVTVTDWEGRPLSHKASYFFRVRAVNDEGFGNFSSGVWAAPTTTGGVTTQASRSLAEPLTLSVADVEAREGPGAELVFEVSLDRAASEAVSVTYTTMDGTAAAGEDYMPASGVLNLAPGEKSGTVRVSVLEDAHDEGSETLILNLSNAAGALVADGSATGTISNSDPMPKAWLARFGRAASDQTAQAISRRLERGPRVSHLTLGGMRVNDLFKRVQDDAAISASATSSLPGDLMNSSFYYSHDGREEGAGQWTSWGETVASRFQSGDGPLTLNGEVATVITGLDSQWGNWLAGAAFSLSQGKGAYSHMTATGGDVVSNLTSINPYVRYQLDERISLWGTLGYGKGSLDLTPGNSESVLETGLTNAMAAFGGRGALAFKSLAAGNFELAIRSDVLFTDTRSDSVAGLIATEAATSRARILLEGSGSMPLASGGTLRPTLETGLRYDAGDAETGMGFEIGGGLEYAKGRLTTRVDGRALVAHQADAYREWGMSVSLSYQPGADGNGLGLRLGSAWGINQSGMRELWDMQHANALSKVEMLHGRQRFELEVGYGIGQRWLWYPYIAAERAGNGEMALRTGLKLNAGTAMDARLEIGRTETGAGITQDAVMLQGSLRW